MNQIQKLREAVESSITEVRLRLREHKVALLAIGSYDTIRESINQAKQLQSVQKALQRYEVGAATPPKIDEIGAHEIATPEGKLKAFKRSIILSLWEIDAKLNSLSASMLELTKRDESVLKEVKARAIEIAVDVKACKEALGLVNPLSRSSSGARPSTPRTRLDSQDDTFIDEKRIKLGKEVGQGAFGKVYKGEYAGEVVAVKCMKVKDDRQRKAITREISLLKEVEHANIVRFIGLSRRNDELMLVMEFVEGGELYDLVTDLQIEMTWEHKLKIARDIANALAYLHGKQIVHRDIKSENLLVDANFNAKLCDFGFARIQEDAAARMSMCGSYYFNAPELLLGNPYDEKVDVYSYGICLCELLTRGQVDLTRYADRQFTLDVANLKQHIPKECPEALWKIAFSCCNFNPAQRPPAEKVYLILTKLQELQNKK